MSGWHRNNRNVFLTVLGAGKLRRKVVAVLWSSGGCFLCPNLCFLLLSSHGGRGEEAPVGLIHRNTNPHSRIPKGGNHWGVEFQHINYRSKAFPEGTSLTQGYPVLSSPWTAQRPWLSISHQLSLSFLETEKAALRNINIIQLSSTDGLWVQLTEEQSSGSWELQHKKQSTWQVGRVSTPSSKEAEDPKSEANMGLHSESELAWAIRTLHYPTENTEISCYVTRQ